MFAEYNCAQSINGFLDVPFIGINITFLLFLFKAISLKFPEYEDLHEKTGYVEKCWEFSRASGGRSPSRFLAVQLKESGFFSLQSMHERQYKFVDLCKDLETNKNIPVKILFEDPDYEHAWNAFFVHPKENGFIWELRQRDDILIHYDRILSVEKKNRDGIIVTLLVIVLLMTPHSIYGIKDAMRKPKRRRKKIITND